MRSVMTAVFLLASTICVTAQTPEGTPTRVRGTIDRVDGQAIVVTTGSGQEVPVVMGPNFVVSAVVKRTRIDGKTHDPALAIRRTRSWPAWSSTGRLPW
jgi:hypothetical protein